MRPISAPRRDYVSASLFSILLVFGIAAEILYLSKDLRLRWDTTAEGLFTPSPSTQKVLAKLKKKLVIEAYFSSKLPGYMRQQRQQIVEMLDEYEQSSGGKLSVLYFDPLEDQAIEDRARRLGIRKHQANDFSDDSASFQVVWQGVMLRYGGDKKKVIETLGAQQLEETLTPQIRELVLDRKPKIGFIAKPQRHHQWAQSMGQQPTSWDTVKKGVEGRFDVVTLDLGNGELLPADLDVLVVIEPKDMNDWEKYCIDQFVMGGGNLIVFADAADYSIDHMNSYQKSPYQLDTPDSKLKWNDMLASYGIESSYKVVAELQQGLGLLGTVILINDDRNGFKGGALMPYWVQVKPLDWKKLYNASVKDPTKGQELRDKYHPGFEADHPLLSSMRFLDFFWPTEVLLSEKLPEGVEGKVLVYTSPVAVAQIPPQSTRPDDRLMMSNLIGTSRSEGKQVGLMATVKGSFTSAFKGMDIPKRPGADKNGAVLVRQDPVKSADAKQGTEKKADEKKADEKKADDSGDAKASEPQTTSKPAKVTLPGEILAPDAPDEPDEPDAPDEPDEPDAPDEPDDGRDPLPARIDKGKVPGRIVVVGDANMIRDDHLRGYYGMMGMARSANGQAFFDNLVDWMSLDLDLVELRSSRTVDRRIIFDKGDGPENESEEAKKMRIAWKKAFLRWANTLGPIFLILVFGLITFSVRAGEKRRFLASLDNPKT